MVTMPATAGDRYLAEFETLERRGAWRSPSWLAPLRRAAMTRFSRTGFPTVRDEDWRYTNLAPLAAESFPPAGVAPDLPARAVERLTLGATGWPRVVVVDGRYSARHSSTDGLPRGVVLRSLADAIAADDGTVERHLARHAAWEASALAALNTAFLEDGVFLSLPPEGLLPTPIELLVVAATPGVLAQPRVLIVAGPHSRGRVVERYVALTGDAYFTNAVTEVVVGPGAAVEHSSLQEQAPSAFHVATLAATLERDSALTAGGVTFGGRLARTTLTLGFRGEGAQATLNGLYVVGGRQHVDNHVTVDHAVPRCVSRQLYKGVLDGSARAVFNGRILVRPGAQKTDASQTNKHLLLGDGVEVDSKPQLEIFADDVKCTHGAAEGQPAPAAIFYLRSRGLGEAAARALLTYGFAREVVERLAVEPLQTYVDRALTARLRGTSSTGEPS